MNNERPRIMTYQGVKYVRQVCPSCEHKRWVRCDDGLCRTCRGDGLKGNQ